MSEKLNKIVLFFGGKSVEREVSIITAHQVLSRLNPFKIKVFPVYINADGKWLYGEELKNLSNLKKIDSLNLKQVCFLPNDSSLYILKRSKLKKLDNIDCVLNCCHGSFGEDGCLSGVINCASIASASPDVLAGSVSMNKEVSKYFFKGLGLDVVDFQSFSKTEFLSSTKKCLTTIKKLGLPVVVKPCSLGSSVGVSFCKNLKDVQSALELAFQFDENVVVEKGLENFDEFFCSAFELNGKTMVSEVEKMQSNTGLDFNKKYITGAKKEFPAKIDKSLKDEIKGQTKLVYEKLKCFGIIRIDFLFDREKNKLYINEANVVPGSMAMEFWAKKFDFGDMMSSIIEQAKQKFKNKEKLNFKFSSNVLENFELSTKNKLK